MVARSWPSRSVDHVSQRSIYFHDLDGNVLEIYRERPDALAIFAQRPQGRDEPFMVDPVDPDGV